MIQERVESTSSGETRLPAEELDEQAQKLLKLFRSTIINLPEFQNSVKDLREDLQDLGDRFINFQKGGFSYHVQLSFPKQQGLIMIKRPANGDYLEKVSVFPAQVTKHEALQADIYYMKDAQDQEESYEGTAEAVQKVKQFLEDLTK